MKTIGISCVLIKKEPYMSQILLKVRLIDNRTSCRPVWSAITYTNHTRDY